VFLEVGADTPPHTPIISRSNIQGLTVIISQTHKYSGAGSTVIISRWSALNIARLVPSRHSQTPNIAH